MASRISELRVCGLSVLLTVGTVPMPRQSRGDGGTGLLLEAALHLMAGRVQGKERTSFLSETQSQVWKRGAIHGSWSLDWLSWEWNMSSHLGHGPVGHAAQSCGMLGTNQEAPSCADTYLRCYGFLGVSVVHCPYLQVSCQVTSCFLPAICLYSPLPYAL